MFYLPPGQHQTAHGARALGQKSLHAKAPLPCRIPAARDSRNYGPGTGSPGTPWPAQAPAGPDAVAANLVNTVCSSCHNLDRVRNKVGDNAAWTATVTRMKEKGTV